MGLKGPNLYLEEPFKRTKVIDGDEYPCPLKEESPSSLFEFLSYVIIVNGGKIVKRTPIRYRRFQRFDDDWELEYHDSTLWFKDRHLLHLQKEVYNEFSSKADGELSLEVFNDKGNMKFCEHRILGNPLKSGKLTPPVNYISGMLSYLRRVDDEIHFIHTDIERKQYSFSKVGNYRSDRKYILLISDENASITLASGPDDDKVIYADIITSDIRKEIIIQKDWEISSNIKFIKKLFIIGKRLHIVFKISNNQYSREKLLTVDFDNGHISYEDIVINNQEIPFNNLHMNEGVLLKQKDDHLILHDIYNRYRSVHLPMGHAIFPIGKDRIMFKSHHFIWMVNTIIYPIGSGGVSDH